MGENKKSSAAAVEIKPLQDLFVTQVSMGVAHSVFLVKPKDEKMMKKLETFQVLDQSDQD